MKDETDELERSLQERFGSRVKTSFVDVFSRDMDGFAEIGSLIRNGLVRLPLVVINGRPRIHGGISQDFIAQAVGQLLNDD